MRKRGRFTDEFKAEAVALVIDEGMSIAKVSKDLDLTPSSLSAWVNQAKADRGLDKSRFTTEERAELAKLRKENRELRMEREILKNHRRRPPLLDQKLSTANMPRSERRDRQLFGASEPVKKHGPGMSAGLSVATLRRSRLGK